jgi:flagellar hook-length control protein FliK
VTSKSARSTASEASIASAESTTDPTVGSLVSNPAPDATQAASTQFKVETRAPAPTHLAHQVVSAIQKAADEGPHLRIHLTPPALGSLIVDISRTENGVVARLEFSNSQAQQAAMQSLPDLQQALAQQGIKVDRIDVRLQDANQQFNRGREDQPRDQRDSQSRPDRRQEQPKQQSNQTEDEDNADSTT